MTTFTEFNYEMDDLNQMPSPSPPRKKQRTQAGVGFGSNDDEYASILSGHLGSLYNTPRNVPPSSLAHNDDDDGSGGMGVRVEDLAVANERGEVLGHYVPSPQLTLDAAYSRFVKSSSNTINDFDVETMKYIMGLISDPDGTNPIQTHMPRHNDDNGGEDDEDEDDYRDTAEKALSRLRPSDNSSAKTKTHERPRQTTKNGSIDEERRKLDRLSEFGYKEDYGFLLEHFSSTKRMAYTTDEELFNRICPLCGFMDNTQDGIPDREFEAIDRFADDGIGNIDPRTHAMLLAFMWNKTIYLPMRNRGEKILPLTSRMAYHHITKPHRWNMRAVLKKDIDRLEMMFDITASGVYRENGMTGELSMNKDMLNSCLNILKTKYSIATTDLAKDPFRTGHRPTGTSAGRQTNPSQAIRRSITVQKRKRH